MTNSAPKMIGMRPAAAAIAILGAAFSSGLAIIPAANAAQEQPSANRVTASSTAAASTAPCVFGGKNASSCKSSNPEVKKVAYSGSGDCSTTHFDWQINWGDGSPVEKISGHGSAPNQNEPIASHTYKKRGTFTIHVTGKNTNGGPCSWIPTTYTFTLEPVSGDVKLSALGDSYSAGNGTPEARGDCSRSPQAWPELVPEKVGGKAISTSVTLLACSGAESNGSGAGDLPAQIAELRKLKPRPSLATVTVGGDDGKPEGVGFRKVLTKCHVTEKMCAAAKAAELSWIHKKEPALLRQDFAAIKAAAPSVTLLVVGYPQIFPSNKGCRGYSKAEMKDMSELAGPLDSALETSAAKVPGVVYVPATNAFKDHLLCSAKPWVVPPLTVDAQTGIHDWLHPTVDGQDAIAKIVANFIKSRL